MLCKPVKNSFKGQMVEVCFESHFICRLYWSETNQINAIIILCTIKIFNAHHR
jgi:hypothetical protein